MKIKQWQSVELFSSRGFAILLAMGLAVVYWPVLMGGETFFYRDFGALAIPTASYQKQSLLAGEIPFWNPYSNCGAPFLAQWGTMVLYPLSLIYVLLPMPWSLNFFCIAHLWLGGMGMYFLARGWCGEGWPAALAGIAFTFNGITQAALGWPNYVAALALFPWAVLSMERTWSASPGPMTARVLAGSGLIAAQLLAGVPELSAMTLVVITALWGFRLLTTKADWKRLALCYSATITAAFGIASIQLFPFFELLQNSQRMAGMIPEKWALPPFGWANLVLPRFHTFVTPEGTVFQYGQAFLSSSYLGAPLLVLAACALLRFQGRVLTLATVAIAAVLMALGAEGLIYTFLSKMVPLLGVARYPVKFLFLVAMIVPLLTAVGAQNLSAIPTKRRNMILGGAAALLTLTIAGLILWNYANPREFDRLDEFTTNSAVRWLFMMLSLGAVAGMFAFRAQTRRLQLVLLLLLVSDWMTHLPRLNPTIESRLFKGTVWTDAHTVPKPALGSGRLFISPALDHRLTHSSITDPEQDLITKRVAEWSHLNLLDEVPKVNGSSTLQVRPQAWLQGSLYSGTNRNTEVWLDFLNVTHHPAADSPFQVKLRDTALPFVTAGQEMVAPTAEMVTEPIDFRTEAVVHSNLYRDEVPERANVGVTVLKATARELRFEADASTQALAIVAQRWYPSWRVEVQQDGRLVRDVPVLRVNLAFQGAVLPPGKSSVRFYYHDHSFWIGAAVSGLTVLIVVVCWRLGY